MTKQSGLTILQKEACGMLELLTTFIVRYEITIPECRELVKQLFVEHCIGSRNHDTAIKEFLNKLDNIIELEQD